MGTPPPNEPQAANEPTQPETPVAAEAQEARIDRYERKATASVLLAVLALVSMIVTAPLAMFAMLATYPSTGPSEMPWVAPLVFFSLPLLFALPSLVLAISVLRNSPDTSPDRSSAALALCLAGLVFVLALGPGLDQLGNP
jgi:hypothetical protein